MQLVKKDVTNTNLYYVSQNRNIAKTKWVMVSGKPCKTKVAEKKNGLSILTKTKAKSF